LFNWDSAEDMKEMMLMNYPPISAILSVPFACHLERTELFLIFVTSWLLQICGTKTIPWLATFHQGF